jgi:molybdopterin/thiamine biosynthesis adenylyltransferase
MKIQKIAVIGCGGIAVNLVPALSRLYDLVLVDGDKYEPKNVERQFPALHSTDNKAKVLKAMVQPHTLKKVEHIESFVKDGLISNHPEWKGVDMIVGCVDNNSSRKILIGLGDEFEIPVIVAGNETEDGEAHAYIPRVHNPLDHFDFPEGEPTPWACNHDKHVEKFPQTPLANIMAASAVFHILLSMRKVAKLENAVVHSRLEPLSSTFRRAKSFQADKSSPKAEFEMAEPEDAE